MNPYPFVDWDRIIPEVLLHKKGFSLQEQEKSHYDVFYMMAMAKILATSAQSCYLWGS